MTESSLRVAVDIGGTFTDTVLMRGTEVLASAKTLTTHGDPSEGAETGVATVLETAGRTLSDLDGFVHGTTLATNALIERRGAEVATITTQGFRDILEIAYERRYEQYNINIEKPDLIVPRRRALTVPERVSPAGEVLSPLDEAALPGLLATLEQEGIEAVAICLLHAYANPTHEQRLGERLLAAMPGLSVSLSSEVSPEAREFDRLCTTIANAYIRPLMAGYLGRFAARFAEGGLRCPILMMTSGGGMTTLETAARLPVRLVESGPAGGAILSARIARELGLERVLSFDMGGTTAKLCLIDGFTPQTSRQFEVARAARFVKGSGMPLRIPVVEMIEIGAGGGSIASVDRLGRLAVGPKSAGSEPGPAAFRRGGEAATVTDADVVLGLIDPERFAEGSLTLDPGASETALMPLAAALDMDTRDTARGISEIVDENMAAAGRMHAVESGTTLEDRAMIALGGNGPLHATRVARRGAVRHVVIPPAPSVGSAVGFLHAPVSFELVRSRYALLQTLDVADINALLDAMEADATAVVAPAAPGRTLSTTRAAFMRYKGQGHEIQIALPESALSRTDLPALQSAFERDYAAQFSRAVAGMEIEILNWMVSVSTSSAPVSGGGGGVEDIVQPPPQGTRSITCDVTGNQIDAAVYLRADLAPGALVPGPALIVEPQTTTLVSADFTATPDRAGNLHLMTKEP